MAAGNSVVLKPSEKSPVSILKIAKFLDDSGLPKGVFNVVQGFGTKIGKKLCENKYVSKIDLTGGDNAGRKIGEYAGKNGIYYATELGGKSPMLVFDDCEINKTDINVKNLFMINTYTLIWLNYKFQDCHCDIS